MEEHKEYINKELQKLVNEHTEVYLYYEYDDVAQTYYVEVDPHIIDSIKKPIADITNRFIKKFPFYSIAFYDFGDIINYDNKVVFFTAIENINSKQKTQ